MADTRRFTISSAGFSGSLAELIENIQSDAISILDISLSDITASFLEYMERHVRMSLVDTVEVYFYASQLLLIKSRYLMGAEEQVDSEQLKEGVIEILIEFQRLKKLADELRKRKVEDTRTIARQDKTKSILRHYREFDRARKIGLAQESEGYAPSMVSPPQELSEQIGRLLQKRRVVKALPQFDQFPLHIMRQRLLQAIQKRAISLHELIADRAQGERGGNAPDEQRDATLASRNAQDKQRDAALAVRNALASRDIPASRNDYRRAQLISALLVILIAAQRRTAQVSQPQPFAAVTISKR